MDPRSECMRLYPLWELNAHVVQKSFKMDPVQVSASNQPTVTWRCWSWSQKVHLVIRRVFHGKIVFGDQLQHLACLSFLVSFKQHASSGESRTKLAIRRLAFHGSEIGWGLKTGRLKQHVETELSKLESDLSLTSPSFLMFGLKLLQTLHRLADIFVPGVGIDLLQGGAFSHLSTAEKKTESASENPFEQVN